MSDPQRQGDAQMPSGGGVEDAGAQTMGSEDAALTDADMPETQGSDPTMAGTGDAHQGERGGER